MNNHEKIAAWSNDNSGSSNTLFVSRLRNQGFSDLEILKVLSVVEHTCLHCFDENSNSIMCRHK